MKAVYQKELKAYMNNLYGLIFSAVILAVVGVMIFLINLNASHPYADLSPALSYGEYALIAMVPVLCMRSMAEDRRNNADTFYFSLPLRTSSVVLGKYFALLTVNAIPTLILCLYPPILGCFGSMNYLHAYLAILMFYLMGAALIAVCMFISSLTKYMVVAGIVGLSAMGLLFLLPQLALILPSYPLISYVGFFIIIALLSVGVFFFTKNRKFTIFTASVALSLLSVAYIVLEVLTDNAFFDGLLHTCICNVSPFFLFDLFLMDRMFDLFSITMLLSLMVFFVFLTVQSANKRRLS